LEEEVTALQADLDNLDSQLDRALNIQKTSEEKYEALREAFDGAAEHLVRLENEQQSWTAKEGELVGMVEVTGEELERLHGENAELKKLSEELSTLTPSSRLICSERRSVQRSLPQNWRLGWG
jgi:myosin protein heavy chain